MKLLVQPNILRRLGEGEWIAGARPEYIEEVRGGGGDYWGPPPNILRRLGEREGITGARPRIC